MIKRILSNLKILKGHIIRSLINSFVSRPISFYTPFPSQFKKLNLRSSRQNPIISLEKHRSSKILGNLLISLHFTALSHLT